MDMDKMLIDFLDHNVTLAQRRHGFHVYAAKVWITFAMVVTTLAYAVLKGWSVLSIINVVMFGFLLMLAVVQFKMNADYPENVRKTQRLNADVLLRRQVGTFMRLFNIGLFLGSTGGDVVNLIFRRTLSLQDLFIDVILLMIVLVVYLECCMLMGPGDFARDRVKVLDAVGETQ